MSGRNKSCVDAGSVNCPCILAACEDCMICSRLAGKPYCDCKWQGICVYSEYMQNGSRPVEQRRQRTCAIQKKIWYEKDLAVMRIEVPCGFAEKASVPGSCVFVRAKGENCFTDVPISVMRTDYENGLIDIAVKAVGPKSRKLLEADRYVELRGVYSNGLIGVEKLMAGKGKRVLCLAKGVGIAPVSNYCRWAGGRDTIDVVADLDKVNRFFAEDCISGSRIRSIRYDKLPLGDLGRKADAYDVILLCASEYYQKNITIPEAKAVYSNNYTMCCGEGMCGACIRTDEHGNGFRMCKCREK